MKVLVIAPHPDDEVLGCGGTIKKHSKKKDEVYLCIVTKAYTPEWTEEFILNREKEVLKANKVLGIKETFFLNFPTVKLDTLPQKKLNDSIGECLSEVKPEIVYLPYGGDINKDHRLVFEASLVAVRPKLPFALKRVLAYEIPCGSEWAVLKREDFFRPNIYIDISDTLDAKLKAMNCYKSELKNYPHYRSLEGIKIWAQKRGIESGFKAAEAFTLIREIKSEI